MKRVLSRRNRMVFGIALLAMLLSASSFTFSPSVDAKLAGDGPQKKEQKVKVIVKKDGKETKIDTTFNLPDERMINWKVDSMLTNLGIERNDSGRMNVLIHHPGKHMKYMSRGRANLPENEEFDVMIQQNDSGITKHIRKNIRIGENGDAISLSDMEDNEFLAPPPPPPPPPMPPFMMNGQSMGDQFEFDTNDGSVISYTKKDIGKGLEKITIIRKKRSDNKRMEEVNVETEISDDSKK